ncbi:hypothetical protein N0V83_006338 [Neocucurbitaria cava]|uniref:Uncharacterized protein n=1 Tax=Neocucurbitaria cava TaxID=798079 RepID=A0A9W9CLJ3_9PLEO|nr:hypothetical protein N0V83_006338 [Neocucurbitaria cava]
MYREATLIAQIKKTTEERVARAEAEKSAALELVAQLQSTSASNKTVMEQHLKLQPAPEDKAKNTDERARRSEEEKQELEILVKKLRGTIDELQAGKTSAEAEGLQLRRQLDIAQGTNSLLEEQKQKLQAIIDEYSGREMTWREDRATIDSYALLVGSLDKRLARAFQCRKECDEACEVFPKQYEDDLEEVRQAIYEQ